MSKPGANAITLREAFDDLGWFWLVFTTIVGAPSLLSLFQTVFIDHRLIEALQWIVDGYNDILAAIGVVLEPYLKQLLAWLNEVFGWRLELFPHWRSTLVLAVLFPSSICRSQWRQRRYMEAIVTALLFAVAALASSVAVGAVALDGTAMSLGLTAGLPIASLVLATGFAMVFFDPEKTLRRWPNWLLIPGLSLGLGGAAFGLAANAARDPASPPGAGLLIFAFIVFVLAGVPALFEGGRFMRRMGLTVLGGFIAAGAILAADALIQWLSV